MVACSLYLSYYLNSKNSLMTAKHIHIYAATTTPLLHAITASSFFPATVKRERSTLQGPLFTRIVKIKQT
jgi:hypothetical protein